MRSLVVSRAPTRFAAARLLSRYAVERAVESGPLTLRDGPAKNLPSPEWRRVTPLLSGICGSDLATVFFETSRYFEPLTSFPFTPGHEAVVELSDEPGTRYVLEPALTCSVRGVPLCGACTRGETELCSNITVGDLSEGIQTGYCSSTGGAWSTEFIAHLSTLHRLPEEYTLEDSVMIEPFACAIHAALRPAKRAGSLAVIGAGTVGLSILAAARALGCYSSITIAAKHPIQREIAGQLGADAVIQPGELARRARRTVPSNRAGRYIGGGFDVVIDAVGSSNSLETAILGVVPGGEVVVAGMPATTHLDLAPLWHREVTVKGSYAYGTESLGPEIASRLGQPSLVRTFSLAIALASTANIGRMVTHRYRLADYVEAVAKARAGGREDAVKVVFDIRKVKHDG